jgi:phosphatidylserine decarboxylase
LRKYLYRFFIELTNRPFLSKWLERFTRSPFSRKVVPSFSRIYNLNQEEMEKPLSEYETLHHLFTRKLKKPYRMIEAGENIVTSPVDAVLEEFGMISDEKTFKVKGKAYSISEMLENDRKREKYIKGSFLILYLSPSHYHRIHAPISGEITSQWSLGTSSYPVNQWGIEYGKSPFTKNYRVITEIVNKGNHIALVKVGAMFVNGIELTHQGESIIKGEEIAYFSFGSTVILLFEKDTFTPKDDLVKKMEVQVGQPLGTLKVETTH